MELINATKMQAGYTLGMDPDGRERIVVVVKGTFTIPENGGQPVLADEQVPLVMADEFTGEPGLSATLYESEFAPFKPRCDVLLNGSAHAPGGKPAQRVRVSLRVGAMKKSFQVVGNRVWEKHGLAMVPTKPEPFTVMPISYDRAFGGVDTDDKDPDKVRSYTANPVGVGYYPLHRGKSLQGLSLPNTEEKGKSVDAKSGKYRPMAFGAIGRNFAERYPLAGTYDQDWIDNVFPFLPKDFDPRYYQAAPADQQIAYPVGGEKIELLNLMPRRRRVRFLVPKVDMPVEFTDATGRQVTVSAPMDTVIIEPDSHRVLFGWRASQLLPRNVFDIRQAVAGTMPSGWYLARKHAKEYYPSLNDAVTALSEREES